MRFSWLFFLIVGVVLVYGQQPLTLHSETHIVSSYNDEKSSPYHILRNLLSLEPDEQLLLSERKKSPGGIHYTYQQWYKGKPVYLAGVKVHYSTHSRIVIQDYRAPIYTEERNGIDVWWSTPSGLKSATLLVENDGFKKIEKLVDANGNILFDRDLLRYSGKDSTAYTRVFKINPINSANTVYGGDFIDNNDSDNQRLTDETYWAPIQVEWRNDTFFLESEFMYFEDFASPKEQLNYYQLTDSFAYTRSQQEFELVNTYYHLNRFAQYINDLGYTSIIEKVKVDVHGFGGADNSAYDPNEHSLQFGEGGVDDAEDGEVVVHEYVHGLSEIASANTTIGAQREAMEEGICDYMAKAYSRTFNDNTSDQIFSWDGHNEFWSGIDINTNRTYPDDLRNFKDGDRDMWSSALMCIHDIIGRKATDSLVLEHLFYQKPNATMPEMALIMLSIDTAVFNSRYSSVLRQCFSKAGFIPTGSTLQFPNTSIKVRNSYGFLSGQAPLRVEGLNHTSYKLYKINGQLIQEGIATTQLELSPSDVSKGIYLLHLTTNGNSSIIKLVR